MMTSVDEFVAKRGIRSVGNVHILAPGVLAKSADVALLRWIYLVTVHHPTEDCVDLVWIILFSAVGSLRFPSLRP